MWSRRNELRLSRTFCVAKIFLKRFPLNSDCVFFYIICNVVYAWFFFFIFSHMQQQQTFATIFFHSIYTLSIQDNITLVVVRIVYTIFAIAVLWKKKKNRCSYVFVVLCKWCVCVVFFLIIWLLEWNDLFFLHAACAAKLATRNAATRARSLYTTIFFLSMLSRVYDLIYTLAHKIFVDYLIQYYLHM